MLFSYLFLFIVLMASIYYKSPSVSGRIGKKRVRNTLMSLDQHDYKIFNDLYLTQEDGQTSQIDHVVLSPYGVFVIETKNYKGWIIGTERSQNWIQVIYKRKHKFYNPIWQNYGHIEALKNFLDEFTEGVPFYSIVVFSNEADLKFKEPFKEAFVMNRSSLVKSIRNTSNDQVLSFLKMEQIKLKLLKLENIDKNEKRQLAKSHVETIKRDLKDQRVKIQNNVCPRCGNELVTRKGTSGAFKGCSNYPKCRYTA